MSSDEKDNNNIPAREPSKTRQTSAQEKERRNSVSEITDYFQTQIISASPMMPKKSKNKDKEKNKEIRATKENIKAMINQIGVTTENANGDVLSATKEQCVQSTKKHDNSESNEENLREASTQTSEDEILNALKELAVKYQKLDKDINNPKLGLNDQLAKTQSDIQKLYTDIHGAVDGIDARLTSVAKSAAENMEKIVQIENSQTRMSQLLDENKRLVQELQIMQGLVQKISQKSDQQTNQILDLTKRGMEQNLVLHGVDDTIEKQDAQAEEPFYTYRERAKYSALKFFKDILNLDLRIEDIWKAHRSGAYKPDKVRPIIVKVSYSAKDLIMEHVTDLKGKSNPLTKQAYFISEQIPEGISETKKLVSNRMKSLKEINEKKPKEERQKLLVVNDKILIDGELDVAEVTTPQPSQLFLDANSQKEIDLIQSKMVETESKTERNSEFRALALKVHSIKEVQQAYIAVAQRFPTADHIAMANALRDQDIGRIKSGFCDDREYGAGVRMKKSIYEEKSKNTAVFMLRKYGGVHLGFNRFHVIDQVVKDALGLLNAAS